MAAPSYFFPAALNRLGPLFGRLVSPASAKLPWSSLCMSIPFHVSTASALCSIKKKKVCTDGEGSTEDGQKECSIINLPRRGHTDAHAVQPQQPLATSHRKVQPLPRMPAMWSPRHDARGRGSTLLDRASCSRACAKDEGSAYWWTRHSAGS